MKTLQSGSSSASSDPRCKHAQDRLQFAYQPGVGVEDAILYLLHRAHSHLDKGSGTVRILFLDFSSAFNTIQPSLLRRQTEQDGSGPPADGLDLRLPHWQTTVRRAEGHHIRHGGQQHWSPPGHSAGPSSHPYTDFCTPQTSATTRSCVIFRNTLMTQPSLGALGMTERRSIRRLVGDFAAWCHTNHLQLNTSKTKELVIRLWEVQTKTTTSPARGS
ncbi:hypothetical protein L3Q82_006315 [Scortum barcoo]|uniref:Uncharacterized protein n=1 Tax=Scortum barcoo TaxID=214431 RepID=A0ACB8X6D1_9TELE|nr:hypothetical protein L3Q82_006315 [Scortum barcoo]